MNPVAQLENLARRVGSALSWSKNKVPFVKYDEFRVAYMGRGKFFRVFKNDTRATQIRVGDFQDVEEVVCLLTDKAKKK